MKMLTEGGDGLRGLLLAYDFILKEPLLRGSLGLLVGTWAGEVSVLLHVRNFHLRISIISLNTLIFNLT